MSNRVFLTATKFIRDDDSITYGYLLVDDHGKDYYDLMSEAEFNNITDQELFDLAKENDGNNILSPESYDTSVIVNGRHYRLYELE